MTDDEAQKIRKWPMGDAMGWFSFIKGLWTGAWDEAEVAIKNSLRISLATNSDHKNEEVIHNMRENGDMWRHCWHFSHRGGYHEFEIPNYWYTS